jgi:hypothetical protein
MTLLAIFATALVLTACTQVAPITSPSSDVSSSGAFNYTSASTSSGSGNAYNWLEGGD